VAAPKGNKFWLARSSHGRDPIFKSPDALWSAAVEYFEWVEDNPLYEAKVAANKGEPDIVDVRKMRAMSIRRAAKLSQYQPSKVAKLRANEMILLISVRR
jgi:hypothetical protein